MTRVLLILGTRPEAIKLAPVVLALRGAANGAGFEPLVCLTGQHPELAREALAVFGLTADLSLDCVPSGGDLCVTAGAIIPAVGRLLDETRPDVVMVQGDTLSAVAGGLAAALRQRPLAHVEAGLRSGRLDDPFPEEIARRQLAQLARWSFAPTAAAAANLHAEGLPESAIHLVGNTVVDAIRLVRTRLTPPPRPAARVILVTVHRRENWGDRLGDVCSALRALHARHPDWHFVFSLHPNPRLRAAVQRDLSGSSELLEAPPYDVWVSRMLGCDLILTDSGGLQEEACALGRPVLVLRQVTERPEAVECGTARLVGTDSAGIVAATEEILSDPALYARMARPRAVFGDGYAAESIAQILAGREGSSRRVQADDHVAVVPALCCS